MYYAYVLSSQVDARLYKGHCKDLAVRLQQHNSGKVRSTKGYVPWKLVYYGIFPTVGMVRKREKYLKSGIGREFLEQKLAR